jgi:hypothetical protein
VHLAPAELIAIITEFLRRIPEFRTADGYSVLAAEVDRYLTHLPQVWRFPENRKIRKTPTQAAVGFVT